MWYDLTVRTHRSDVQSLSADVRVPSASPWFNGHFPGNPILPGIAQLGMVLDVIRHAFDAPVKVVEVSRVRFKQMIMPDDRLVVMVESRPTRPGAYVFRITKGEDLACQGTMVVENVDVTDQNDCSKGDS